MAKATYRQKIDGKIFNVGEDIPDLGSIKFVNGGYGKHSELSGNSADKSKLPTEVMQDSSAYMVDTQELLIFDATNTEWVSQS